MHVCSVFGHKQPHKPLVHPNKQADQQTQWITHDSLAINGPRSVLSFPIRSSEGTKYVCCEGVNELAVVLHFSILWLPVYCLFHQWHLKCISSRWRGLFAYMYSASLIFSIFMWAFQELKAEARNPPYLQWMLSEWEGFHETYCNVVWISKCPTLRDDGPSLCQGATAPSAQAFQRCGAWSWTAVFGAMS